MSNSKDLRLLTVLWVLFMVPALCWAGDKKKDNNPPPPPRPAPQARPAPPPRQAAAPSRPAPAANRPNPGEVNRPNRGEVNRPNPGVVNRPNPGEVNRPNRGEVNRPNPGLANRPNPGVGNRPNPGEVNRPNPGLANRPNPGVGNRPNPGEMNRPNPGLANRPTPGVGNRPNPGEHVSNRPPAPVPTRTVATRGGGRVDVGRNNKPIHYVGKGGQEAKFGSRGQIREVHDPKRNMTVEHGLRRGDRRIITERNNRRLVSMGPHRGYSERAYLNRNGHSYYQRTYWAGGHAYARAYRGYDYRGVRYYGYVPAHYYHPVFYGWAYNRWAAPVYYNWGWGPAPWYYGGYFAPAPYYPSASLWLTDFLLAANLQQDYQARKEAEASAEQERGEEPPPDGGAPASSQITPELKEAIAAEVQQQLAEERASAQSPQVNPGAAPVGDQAPPAALDPKQRLFVVSSSLGVNTDDGQECELSPGDVITRLDDNPDQDSKVRVSVMTSKPNDCGVGAMPRVAVNDLQEMHNNFREQLDSGLQTLAQKSGQGGLPPAPDTQTTPGEIPPPVPDGNIDAQLADQQREASEAESQVQQEVQAEPPSQ